MKILFLQFFVRLHHIRKCFTQKGGIFVLEEFSEYAFLVVYYIVHMYHSVLEKSILKSGTSTNRNLNRS